MAEWTYNFEAGTHGNPVGTTDPSNAFLSVTNCLYNNQHPAHGSLGFKLVALGGTARITWDSGSPDKILARVYVYITTLPTVDSELIRIQNVANTGVAVRAYLNSAGKLRLGTLGNASLATDTATFPLNQLVRVELYGDAGTSASNGVAQMAYYLGDSTTATYDSTIKTGQNLAGTDAALGQIRYGANGNPTIDVWLDDVGARTATDAVWGAWPVSNILPTASITSLQAVTAGATATVTISASDSDGSIASYATTVTRYTTSASPASVTVTGSSTATPSWTAGSAGSLDKVSCVVTDNSGGTVIVTTEVVVPHPSGTTLLPLRMDGVGDTGWTIIGGSTYEGQALGDGSNTTRVESPDLTATAKKKRWRLAPSAPPASYRQTILDAVLTTSITGPAVNASKVRFFTANTQVTERATSTLKKTTDNTTSDLTTSDLSLYFDLTSGEMTAMGTTGWYSAAVELEGATT